MRREKGTVMRGQRERLCIFEGAFHGCVFVTTTVREGDGDERRERERETTRGVAVSKARFTAAFL